ncbi:hypothetical protein B0I35DRAFT_441326 [Stachybotrys elegans]|uniref:Uncharacterized protein n=1 Tax=Stachybotrys elegans TaxID=80388 RepID=A0A8K0SIK2_9HYPO|nr:hypothetical protein B0I35DRAFT_441326 [Stachybotrys elegans]
MSAWAKRFLVSATPRPRAGTRFVNQPTIWRHQRPPVRSFTHPPPSNTHAHAHNSPLLVTGRRRRSPGAALLCISCMRCRCAPTIHRPLFLFSLYFSCLIHFLLPFSLLIRKG